jgi:DNA processing protein
MSNRLYIYLEHITLLYSVHGSVYSERMEDVYLIAWIASIPGIGPKRFTSLQQRFSNLSKLLAIDLGSLLKAGVPEKLAQSILDHQKKHSPKEIEEWCKKNATSILTSNDEQYPTLLAQIPDPPVVLYIKGTLPNPNLPTIGVVGTRNITSYGRKVTTELTTQLAHAGFVIVSGFMYGVDAVAHEACIDAAGKTIAVLGYGLGVPFFPRSHDVLAQKVIDSGGCLITEFPPWTFATPGNFPSRNRIVSGLSLGVLVTEAAQKSGSRITASLAVDQGREVFAVPGPMHSQFSEGTKDLVNMGAKLVTSIDDILQEIGFSFTSPLGKGGHERGMQRIPHFDSELEATIYQFVKENTEVTIEDLIQAYSLDARTLSLALSNLELSQVISQSSHGVYSLI